MAELRQLEATDPHILTPESWFDFSDQDQVFKVEEIVRSAYLNPKRLIFTHAQFDEGSKYYYLCKTLDTADKFMQAVKGWSTITEFDAAQVRVYDTSRLDTKKLDLDEWLKNIPNLRWFGPFRQQPDSDSLFFKTRSEVHGHLGFYFYVRFKNKDVTIGYKNKKNQYCGMFGF